MKLIVNADDFGYSKGHNLGILEGFKNGVVRSTSLMVNMSAFDHAIELMKENKELSVGIHLVLTVGEPVCKETKSLINESGKFKKCKEILKNVDIDELRREYNAQFNKFLSTGFKPTHIDFHYGAFEKQYLVASELAKKYNIPVRAMSKEWEKFLDSRAIKHSSNCNFKFYDNNVSEEAFIDILEENRGLDIIEIMTHPAYLDYDILSNSGYNIPRAYELKTLTSDRVKQYIKNSNIELINYTSL